MSFFKDLLNKKEARINNYADFRTWFKQHEKTYFNAVKTDKYWQSLNRFISN